LGVVRNGMFYVGISTNGIGVEKQKKLCLIALLKVFKAPAGIG
jgi:hypothetical protein